MLQWFEIELEYGSGFWWILASLQVVRHWTNMLTQPYGNFAHQRQEQLRTFEFLRFHLPVILSLCTVLRKINYWDAQMDCRSF